MGVAPPSVEILPPLFAEVDVISITVSVEIEIFTVGFIFSDVLEQPQKISKQKKYFFMGLEDKIINRKTNNGKNIVFYYMLSITLFEFLINCFFHTSNESFLLIYIADY